jgi:peptidoglycan/LPS O-acetylase OafA/YrhL
MVLVSHLKWNNTNFFIKTIFNQGFVGVSFFFVLSGFVLSYSYENRFKQGLIGSKEYILLRLARLTPLHFITALPFIFLVVYKGNADNLKIILDLFYLQSWVPSSEYYFTFNFPSWSLSNEMFFYIIFLFIIGSNLKKLVNFTLSLFIIVFLSALLITVYFSDGFVIFGNVSFSHWLFYVFPLFRLLEFLVGMLLFQTYKQGFRLSNKFIFVSYLLLVLAMYYGSHIPESFRMSLYYLPFIAFFLYCHLNMGAFLTKSFSNKLFILLGESSFAFYLIHQPILRLLRGIAEKFSIKYSDFSFFIFSLVVISLLSIFTYLLYEKQAELYLKKIVKRHCTSRDI